MIFRALDSRQRRRRFFIALLTVACAPLSSGLLKAQITNGAERVQYCRASQLSAMEDSEESHEIDGGAGHHAMIIAVQNRSSLPCILQGVPTLTFFDAANHPLPVPVCANCDDYLFRSQPVRKTILQPSKSAYVVLGYNIDDGEHGEIPCRFAAALRMYLPKQREPLKFEVSRGRDKMRSCGPVVVTSFLERPPADGFLPAPAMQK